MNIKLARIQLPENKVHLSFLDDDNRNTVGYCEYDVSGNKGHISYTRIFGDYRNKKIMENTIGDILCDMKCMGANKVTLDPMNSEARNIWEKLGFKKTIDDQTMYTDISDKNCNCTCKISEFKNEIKLDSLLPFKYPRYRYPED